MSLLGMFGLSGIIINDSIVLISRYRNILLEENGIKYNQAIIKAVQQRFRAIVLTTLTTILGLTPLMFEASAATERLVPIATSICFGMFFGLFVILFLVPSLLSLHSKYYSAHKKFT